MIEAPIRPQEGSGIGWFFNHLPAILWHRKWWIIGSFVALFTAAVVTAFMLPTIYRSTATLLVQSQDLPTDLVQSPTTGAIEQRIARIRERVLSRGDLIALIEQNDLYSEERRSKPMSTVIEKMRKSTTVGALASDIGSSGGQQSNTIAINMAFDYPEPAKAQAVLQSFVTSFLRMDTESSEDQATLSVRFLEDQARKLQTDISTIERQLTELKARNGAALASSGVPSMVDTGSYSAQIANLENQNRQLMAQLRRPVSQNTAVAQAEANLAAMQAMYNDSHPDVQAARERLAAAKATAQNVPDTGDAGMIRAQIESNNATIANLSQSRSDALARAQASMAGSARAPAIMEQAMQLENRAAGLREQYREVATNLLKAQNSARLATEQRAERLSLVEPPNLPDKPQSPNRLLLIAAGAVAGLGLGLVLALGIELLSRPLRSPAQVEALGFPVLGVVPKFDSELPGEKVSLLTRLTSIFSRRRARLA